MGWKRVDNSVQPKPDWLAGIRLAGRHMHFIDALHRRWRLHPRKVRQLGCPGRALGRSLLGFAVASKPRRSHRKRSVGRRMLEHDMVHGPWLLHRKQQNPGDLGAVRPLVLTAGCCGPSVAPRKGVVAWQCELANEAARYGLTLLNDPDERAFRFLLAVRGDTLAGFEHRLRATYPDIRTRPYIGHCCQTRRPTGRAFPSVVAGQSCFARLPPPSAPSSSNRR